VLMEGFKRLKHGSLGTESGDCGKFLALGDIDSSAVYANESSGRNLKGRTVLVHRMC
jgi:hypothetical protein